MRISNEISQKDSKVRIHKNEYEKWDERISRIDRVVKVGKGGKKLRFRAIIIVGNKRGYVGVGVGKATDLTDAISKGVTNAKKKRYFF